MEKTFLDCYLDGECELDAIDDFVERWHTDKGGIGMSLQEYLGFTNSQYAAWIKTPDVMEAELRNMRERRKKG